jgi:hypothetical protein
MSEVNAAHAAQMIMQPTEYRKGEDISAAAVDGKWPVTNILGDKARARAVLSKVDGTLMVHMVDGWNHRTNREAANKVWTGVPVVGDSKPTGVGIFDEIDVTNSTAGLFTAGNMLVGL